ncbi:4'-phosphopantetheinyl transferase superfamily protein [Cyclobacterium sp.]|uniref:4'-phosphopantetheinyl transferase family protein n=1 Tax=Cyclobacterium sp. TaxID=1966343 RepID=UPI0019AD11C6|nr:4'-phosphopantetheinyl transferase superfamily protein [Cyclobacterium sp.]MBD3626861.1 4'-phosphopantetheinyl transferase superfamily protein [Cyclobacterium sp.]
MFQVNIFCEESRVPEWNEHSGAPPSNFLHVWRAPVHMPRQDLDSIMALMNEEEVEKAAKFYLREDKIRYAIGRGFLRRLIGHYLNIDPKTVMFHRSKHNKPILVAHNNFHFNISHAGDWVVFALSKATIGIDIEPINATFDYQEVVTQFFEPSEIDFISKSANPYQSFFKIWTRKEAFLKALGWGLTDHLHHYCFLDRRRSISLPEPIEHKDWQIISFVMEEKYYLSLANPKTETLPLFFDWNALGSS